MSLRKFFIWAVSLVLVVLVYLVYLRFTNIPTKIIQPQIVSTDANEKIDTNKPAMIGNIGVKEVVKAKYPEFNKKRELIGEFGFDKLVHQAANQWELEKPYRNIYRPDFKCFITADKGFVKVEDVLGKPNFKDAVFSGNVVLHAVPQPGSDIAESNLYLDDIHFIGESSVFTTDGPIKFMSENAQLLGRGLEAVYNEGSDRLEYFRIVDLNSMHIRTLSKGTVFSAKNKKSQAEPSQIAQSPQPIASDSNKPVTAPAEESNKKVYTCILNKDVIIDTPQEVVFGENISIDNIIMSGAKHSEGKSPKSVDSNNVNPVAETNIPQPQPPKADMMDIYVTCKGGIMMCLTDSIIARKKIAESNEVIENLQKRVNDFNDPNNRIIFAAAKINYSLNTENVAADGPLKITFYTKDMANTKKDGPSVPMVVTAQQKGLFLATEKQVIFEGSCVGKQYQSEPNYDQEYTIRAPKFTIDLLPDSNSDSPRIKHFTADGGIVQLANARKKGNEVLGFVKLKCNKFDYDPNQPSILATGPGLFAIDNANMPMSQTDSDKSKFSFKKPCYALIENFDTLTYLLDQNRIIADSKSGQISLGYMPVSGNQKQQLIQVTAGHVEAVISSQNDNKYNLQSLYATKGITYHEEKTLNNGQKRAFDFAGTELFYDAQKELITVSGNQNTPCLFNGAQVKGIIYDLKTDNFSFEVVAPGILY